MGGGSQAHLRVGAYASMGYRVAGTAPMEQAYPDLAPDLATSCDLVVYRKML